MTGSRLRRWRAALDDAVPPGARRTLLGLLAAACVVTTLMPPVALLAFPGDPEEYHGNEAPPLPLRLLLLPFLAAHMLPYTVAPLMVLGWVGHVVIGAILGERLRHYALSGGVLGGAFGLPLGLLDSWAVPALAGVGALAACAFWAVERPDRDG